MIKHSNRQQIERRFPWQSGKTRAEWMRHALRVKEPRDIGVWLMIGLAAIYVFLDAFILVLYEPASDWAPL